MTVPFRGVYGIVDAATSPDPVPVLVAMLAGGIRVVQYRAKAGVALDTVRALHARTRAAGALLLVNDDLEAALAADGWHAGQEDLAGRDPAALRARLGTRVFGVSCDSVALVRAAERFGADYVGVGPFAATATKADAGPPIGVRGLREIVVATRLPVVAIGGIELDNLHDVAKAGAAMAAVISTIARSADPRTTSAALVRRWAQVCRA